MIIQNLDFFIVIAIIAVIVLYKATKVKKGENGLSQENSLSIRGISALIIVLHHIIYLDKKSLMHFVFENNGFIPVAIFFFFSGYGLMKNLNKNPNYLNGFFKNRLIKILLPFVCINIIYIILNTLLLGQHYSFFQTIKYIFGIELVNSYAWYVISILILYIGFYISFKFFDKKQALLIITAFTVFQMIVTMRVNSIFKTWLYSSTLCFLVGIYFAWNEEKCVKLINKHYITTLLLSITAFAIPFILKNNFITISTIFYMPIITIALGITYTILNIVIFEKLKIVNKVTMFLGKISYEMYLIQKIVILLVFIYIGSDNMLIYISLCVGITILLAYILNIIFTKIIKKIVKI